MNADADPTVTITWAGTGTGHIEVIDPYLYMVVGECSPPVTACSFPMVGTIELIAYAASDSYFSTWAGDCADAGACYLDNTVDHAVEVTFDLAPTGPSGVQVTEAKPAWNDETSAGCTRPCSPPADPSVAVNATYVLDTVQGFLEIRDRAGDAAIGVAVSDLVDAPSPGDTRVAWDAVHARWLLAEVTNRCGPASDLIFGVSETSDPLGVWSFYRQPLTWTSATMSTSLTADKFAAFMTDIIPNQQDPCTGYDYEGAALVADTATLASHPASLTIWFAPLPAAALAGAAIVDGDAGESDVVDVNVDSIYRIQGTVAGGISVSSEPLPDPGIPPPWSGGILDDGTLWLFDNVCALTPGADYHCVAVAEITGADTTTPKVASVWRAPDGSFGGAMGVSADGVLYFVYHHDLTVPGTSDVGPATFVAIHRPGDPPGMLRPASVLVGASAAAVEPVGPSISTPFARDPTDADAVWQATQSFDADDAGWTTWVSELHGDADGAPAGTVSFVPQPDPTIYMRTRIAIEPSPGAGETTVRISDSPTFSTSLSGPTYANRTWQLDDLTVGGSKKTGLRTVYVQFGDGLGHWGATATATLTLDPSVPDSRLSGTDRYATAAALSKATFLPGVPYAFIATGLDYPDAMAGGGVAAQLGAPLLFVGKTIPAATSTELQRLKPQKIVILGGTGVVSSAVETQLRSFASSHTTVRLAGGDRDATAAAISAWAYPNGAPFALIAYGANFPDALVGGPPSAMFGVPILYAGKTAPSATLSEVKRLGAQYIIVLGGALNIPDEVALQIADQTTLDQAYRVAGPDRYATGEAVDEWAFPSGVDGAFITTARAFPDALSATAIAGAMRDPIVYTGTTVPSASKTALSYLAPKQYWIMGGTNAVPSSVVAALAPYLAP